MSIILSIVAIVLSLISICRKRRIEERVIVKENETPEVIYDYDVVVKEVNSGWPCYTEHYVADIFKLTNKGRIYYCTTRERYFRSDPKKDAKEIIDKIRGNQMISTPNLRR